MAYFITHPPACHLYAKCYGWQETLANFFVKARRSSLTQSVISQVSAYDMSPKESFDHKIPNGISSDPASIPTCDGLSMSDDSSQEKADLLSMANIKKQRLTSTSSDHVLRISTDLNSDTLEYSNELLMTSPPSALSSREDLLSLFKMDNSTDNLIELMHSTSGLSLPSPTTPTTTLNISRTFCDDDTVDQ